MIVLVVTELVERGIEALAAFAGLHGLKVGALAAVAVGLYHYRHVTTWLTSAVGTLAIVGYVLFGVAALGIVAASFGIVDVGTLPDVAGLVEAAAEVVG